MVNLLNVEPGLQNWKLNWRLFGWMKRVLSTSSRPRSFTAVLLRLSGTTSSIRDGYRTTKTNGSNTTIRMFLLFRRKKFLRIRRVTLQTHTWYVDINHLALTSTEATLRNSWYSHERTRRSLRLFDERIRCSLNERHLMLWLEETSAVFLVDRANAYMTTNSCYSSRDFWHVLHDTISGIYLVYH